MSLPRTATPYRWNWRREAHRLHALDPAGEETGAAPEHAAPTEPFLARRSQRDMRHIIFLLIAALALAAAPAASTHPRIVSVSYTYTNGFIEPCGFKPVTVVVRAGRQGALLRRVSALLPVRLPAATGQPVMHDLPTEKLVVHFAGGRTYIVGSDSGHLPKTLKPVAALLRHQLHGPCTPRR